MLYCIAYATDFGLWTSLYLGTNTYYDDRELTIYTTYRYRVTVYNAYGHTISDPSDNVTTFGGTPTKPPVISLSPVNHTAFIVTWKTPSKLYHPYYTDITVVKHCGDMLLICVYRNMALSSYLFTVIN